MEIDKTSTFSVARGTDGELDLTLRIFAANGIKWCSGRMATLFRDIRHEWFIYFREETKMLSVFHNALDTNCTPAEFHAKYGGVLIPQSKCPKCGMEKVTTWESGGGAYACGTHSFRPVPYDGEYSDACNRISELEADNARLVAMLANKGVYFLPSSDFEG